MAENALQMRPDDLVASQLAGGGKLSAPPKPLGEHNGGADQDADAWLLSAGHFRKLYKLAGAPHPRSQRLVGAPVSRRRITSARVGREHQRPACPRSSQQIAANDTTTLLLPPNPALFPYPPQCALAAGTVKRKFDDATKKTWPQHELELIKNGYTTEWGEDFEDLSGDELHAAQECKARCDALAHVYADERKIATNPDAMFEMTYVHDFRQRFVPPPTFGTRRRPPSPSRRPCPTWPFPYAASAPRRPRSPPLVCSVARADSEAVGKNPYFVGYALRMHAFNVVIQTINYVELVVKPAFVSPP